MTTATASKTAAATDVLSRDLAHLHTILDAAQDAIDKAYTAAGNVISADESNRRARGMLGELAILSDAIAIAQNTLPNRY